MSAIRVAMVTEVFFGDGAEERLVEILQEAKRQGADLAVLPEIPLNPWSPATKNALDEDAEDGSGPRHAMMARASTLLLFTSIAAIPAMQTGFGVILDLARAAGVSEEAGYRIGFGALAGLIAVAALIYAGARDVDET